MNISSGKHRQNYKEGSLNLSDFFKEIASFLKNKSDTSLHDKMGQRLNKGYTFTELPILIFDF